MSSDPTANGPTPQDDEERVRVTAVGSRVFSQCLVVDSDEKAG
jgi:hypothetical protein